MVNRLGRWARRLFGTWCLSSFILSEVWAQDPCTVCADGSPITTPNVTVGPIPPLAAVSCGDLDNLLPNFLNTDDPRCPLVQSVGSLCGCPLPQLDEPCEVCNVRDEFRLTEVQYQEQSFTCELLEVSLSTSVESSSERCEVGQETMKQSCGCSNESATPPPIDSEKFVCTPCWDGSDYQRPDKLIAAVAAGYGLSGFPNTTTCKDVVPLVLGASSEDCTLMQVILGGLCGCPRAPGSCQFCPEDDYPLPRPDDLYIPSGQILAPIPTCQEASDMLAQLPTSGEGDLVRSALGISEKGIDFCHQTTLTSYVCGCHGGHRPYMGTSNERQRAALVWMPRITGILSVLGSTAILWDLYGPKPRGYQSAGPKNNVFRGIVTGLSLTDLSSSFAWIASAAPGPDYFHLPYGSFATGVYGVRGNDQSCEAQGFFLEFGMIGSISFNLALCVYYLLVIVHGKREDDLRRWRYFFYAIPPVVTTSMAVAAIPYYEFAFIICNVSAPPSQDSWLYVSIFVIGPISLVILSVTAIMVRIYLHVRRTSRAARRWNFGGDSQVSTRSWRNLATPRRADSVRRIGSTVEDAVFWQCFFYLLAFYMTWPFYYAAQFNSRSVAYSDSYPFWMAKAFFTPLQGFFNALIYARPRIMRWYNARRKNRTKKPRRERSSNTDSVTERNNKKKDTNIVLAKAPAPTTLPAEDLQRVRRVSTTLQRMEAEKIKDELGSQDYDDANPVETSDVGGMSGQEDLSRPTFSRSEASGLQKIRRASSTLNWLDAKEIDEAVESEEEEVVGTKPKHSDVDEELNIPEPLDSKDAALHKVRRASTTLQWIDPEIFKNEIESLEDDDDDAPKNDEP